MRRIVQATAGTGAAMVLLLSLKSYPSPATGSRPTAVAGVGSGGTSASTGSSGSSAGVRTVTGDTVDTRWGPVQVQVELSGSTITSVRVLQAPNDNPRDVQISDYALPVLTEEALAAQSASIDAVSGATFTSDGYIRSLQSALDQAHD